MSETIDNNKGGQYGKYIVQELQQPETFLSAPPEYQELYKKFSNRILWIDNNVVPGAFQMNTAWYFAAPERDPIFEVHVHDYSELIGFYGSDPDDPYNLHGEIIFSIDGEAHRLTKSSLIFIPGGVEHNPMRILRVEKPIFHFSVVMNPEYDGTATYR